MATDKPNFVSVEELVNTADMNLPHVVILGAGASRAVCANGDKNGLVLPLMKDLAEVVGLKPLFQQWGINSRRNFEEIYSDLFEKKEGDKLEKIQNTIIEYFRKLELPDEPTIYDHLVLSLRDKDLIATFNWDPLLMQAYSRNSLANLGMPNLAVLHGGIAVKYCQKDNVLMFFREYCPLCGKLFQSPPLLYPIKKKSYSENPFIKGQWNKLKWGIENAFMITIFGYSGPKMDEEAISVMKQAWGGKGQRVIEQTEFVTIQDKVEIEENWAPFIYSHHYDVYTDFYESWIANNPRRTGEAYRIPFLEGRFIEKKHPIPRSTDFPELWEWYKQFKTGEQPANSMHLQGRARRS